MSIRKIVCIQSRNDFTGSPKVLSQVLRAMVREGYSIDLHCSNLQEDGFLRGLDGVDYYPFRYHMSENKIVRFFTFMTAHLGLVFRLLKYKNQDVVFYINTLLPFGAALAGWCIGKPVYYHIHEAQLQKHFKAFLQFFVRLTCHHAIYVSEYLLQNEKVEGVKSSVIYNALPTSFMQRAMAYGYRSRSEEGRFTVLMLTSLLPEKGLWEYLSLAQQFPKLDWDLVISAKKNDIDAFFEGKDLPQNLKLYPKQSEVHPFYEKAQLVMNLSDVRYYIESFGLTIIEAMAYGIPVIGPPVGGPVELIDEDETGYKIDAKNGEGLKAIVEKLSGIPAECQRLSANARQKSSAFDEKLQCRSIIDLIENENVRQVALVEGK